MNHGPFYRSAEAVTAVHQAEDGIFPGFRAGHAFGRIYAGDYRCLRSAYSNRSTKQETTMAA